MSCKPCLNTIALTRNENPISDNTRLHRLFSISNIIDITKYPGNSYINLRMALSGYTNVEFQKIFIGAGSSEILSLIGALILKKNNKVITSSYTFELYNHIVRSNDSTMIIVESDNYRHNIDSIIRVCNEQDISLIFIDNPCNPTGTYISSKEVERLLDNIGKNITVVIDEAYYEFVGKNDYATSIQLIGRYSNLVVVRTFSKVFGLAGLRLGYSISSEMFVKKLTELSHPFNVGSLAEKIGIAAIDDYDYIKQSIEMITGERNKYIDALSKSKYFTVEPVANYIFLNLGTDKAILQAKLSDMGIKVREFDEYPGHIRISFGSSDVNDLVISVLLSL